jgi:histidine ammonia-lyase
MGTIAARDCVRILELSGQTAAAALLAAVQALRLRIKSGEIPQGSLGPVGKTFEEVCSYFAFLEEDRVLEGDLRKTLELINDCFFDV